MGTVLSYHNNTDIGLTCWNNAEQAYYLIPFANVSSYFRQLNEQINVPAGLVDNCFEFMSTYDPEKEAVLLTLNEDLLTVMVINKDQKPSPEAMAEQLGWSLNRFIAFQYLWEQNPDPNTLAPLFKLSDAEYDSALSVLLS